MPPKRPDGKPPRAPRQIGGPSQFHSVDREATDNTLRKSLEGRRAVKEVTTDLTKEGFAPPRRQSFRFNFRPDSPLHQDNRKPRNPGENVSDPLKGKSPETFEERTQARLRERRQSRDDDRQGEDIRRIMSGRLGPPPNPWLHPTAREFAAAKKARAAAAAAAHAAAGDSDEEIEPYPEFEDYETKEYDGSDVRSGLPDEEEEPINPEPEPPQDFDSAPLVYRANIVPHLRGLPGVVTKPNIDSYFGDSYGPLPSTGFNRAYDLIAQAKHGVTKTSPGMPFPFGASSHASSRRMYRRKPSLVAKDLQNRLDACEMKLSYLLDELSEYKNDPEMKSVERELGKIELETVRFIRGGGGSSNGNDSDTLSESD